MKRCLIKIIIFLSVFLLSGCGKLRTVSSETEEKATTFSNVYDLESGKAYVWDDPVASSIEDDLSADRTGSDVFYQCPAGDINFNGDEIKEYSLYPRSIWMDAMVDSQIPTLTAGKELIYVSDKKVPEKIIFERFYDFGYSIGISNLTDDGGGHFYITYNDTRKDDYKYSIDPKSDAMQVVQFEGLQRLYLDKVGEARVTEENVSIGGTVTGLTKYRTYDCQFYAGTIRHDYRLKACIRCFGSMERFETCDFDFLQSNCIRIRIPEYFKTGYYYVLGVGMLRFIAAEDEALYASGGYGDLINFNDPIKQYDEFGACIYDPSRDDMEPVISNSDEGISEEEIGGEMKEINDFTGNDEDVKEAMPGENEQPVGLQREEGDENG